MSVAPQRAGVEPGAVVAIAHRAGNDRTALMRAIEAGADWIEADIWWQYGHLVARHERAVWRLPIRYDEWKLGLALRPAPRLEQLCDLLAGGPELLVDLKGAACSRPEAIVECLRTQRAVERAAVCGQYWPALDRAVALEPRLRAFYSLGSEQQLDALRARPRELPAITAVSCAEYLLTPAVMDELHARRIAAIAWTVNHAARACDLLAAGVWGVTTDSPEVIQLVRDFRRTRRPS